jgi:hypothetical protein
MPPAAPVALGHFLPFLKYKTDVIRQKPLLLIALLLTP